MNQNHMSITSMIQALKALQERSKGGYGTMAVNQMVNASEALVGTVKARGAETPEMRAVRIDKGVKSFIKKVATLKTEVSTGYAQGGINLDQASVQALNLKQNQWAKSVVDTVVGAKSAGKSGVLGQILEDGDGPSLAALMDAPQLVTKINPEKLREYQLLMEKKLAPELAENRRQFKLHSDAVFAAMKQVNEIAQKAMDVPNFQKALDGDAAMRAAEERLKAATL